MSYSVIIPTLNAEAEIGGLLGILLAQRMSPEKILVIDSSSDDETAKIAASFPRVTVKSIDRSAFDHGGTRHEAIQETTSEYVCFLTQDAIPIGVDYFFSLLAPFYDEHVAMVSGRQIAKPDASRREQLVREYNYPSLSFVRCQEDVSHMGIKAFFASDACSAYRRDAYEMVGGFERPVSTNEDMLIAARFLEAGWKVAYAADAQVFHSHDLTPVEQYRRNKLVGCFLQEKMSEYLTIDETGEGVLMVRYVAKKLLKEKQFAQFAAFWIDCAARLAGNRAGHHCARSN